MRQLYRRRTAAQATTAPRSGEAKRPNQAKPSADVSETAQINAPSTGASAMPAESQAPILDWEWFLFMPRIWGSERLRKECRKTWGPETKRAAAPWCDRPSYLDIEADQASKSSSTSTGPESWPLAETSRSTNSMIAIGEASEARGPVLMMRV
jgi:hypothetical protein